MNRNDDSFDRWDDADPSADDPLRQHLRREAMAERPAFSRELHEQILRHVQTAQDSSTLPQRRLSVRWLPLAAAAMILIALGFTAAWLIKPKPALSPPHLVVDVPNVDDHPSPLAAAELHTATARTLAWADDFSRGDLRGVVTLKVPLLPAQLVSPSHPVSSQMTRRPPRRLLNMPTTQQVMDEVLPPEVKLLLTVATRQQ
jgi:hypothetical protein